MSEKPGEDEKAEELTGGAVLQPVKARDLLLELAKAGTISSENVTEILKETLSHESTTTQSEQRASDRRRRDRMRLALTVLSVFLVAGIGAFGVYLTQYDEGDWDTVKDWMALAWAPLAAFMGAMGSFWFPSRETD